MKYCTTINCNRPLRAPKSKRMTLCNACYKRHLWHKIPTGVYNKLMLEQNFLCGKKDSANEILAKNFKWYSPGCGRNLLELPIFDVHIDHRIPRASGGSNRLFNLQLLCRDCNCNYQAKLYEVNEAVKRGLKNE